MWPISWLVAYSVDLGTMARLELGECFFLVLLLLSDDGVVCCWATDGCSLTETLLFLFTHLCSHALCSSLSLSLSVSLSLPSLPSSAAPTFNRRRQNTIEKQIENLQKDEATLKQMLEMSSTIHRPHQVCVVSDSATNSTVNPTRSISFAHRYGFKLMSESSPGKL